MVKISSIRESNRAFAADPSSSSGLVCVFSGATSGIGASTLEATVSTLRNSKIYVLGRSAEAFKSQQEKLSQLGPSCQVEFIQVNVSLLSDIDSACQRITQEPKVDWLYMSQGLVPLNGAKYTSESIEICYALSYYSRVRLITNLLPQLRKSSSPRILSVLNGGKEQAINEDDLGLENEKNWSTVAAINHSTTSMTLALDFLEADTNNKKLTFMHAFPGLVRTEIFAKLKANESTSVLWSIAIVAIRNIVGFLMWAKGLTPEESGEHQLYHLTSSNFNAGWVHLIDENSEEAKPSSVLQGYREKGLAQKIWDHTLTVFEKGGSR